MEGIRPDMLRSLGGADGHHKDYDSQREKPNGDET